MEGRRESQVSSSLLLPLIEAKVHLCPSASFLFLAAASTLEQCVCIYIYGHNYSDDLFKYLYYCPHPVFTSLDVMVEMSRLP